MTSNNPTHEEGAVRALLPCPFCGSTSIDAAGWSSIDASGPACDDCGASAGSIAGLDNIAAWNRRSPSSPTVPADAEVLWLSMHDDVEFVAAWSAMEARGYLYGGNALENVHLGWKLARAAISPRPTTAGENWSACGSGWVLVPIKPTEAMLTAAVPDPFVQPILRAYWSAMLAARPTPEHPTEIEGKSA